MAKQDLWAEEEAEVLSHYLRGEYVKLVDELATEKPVDTFAHEFAFCSLVIANLRDPSGEVVKKTVAGYDSQRQIRSVRHLVELLDGLRKWETRK